MTERDYFLIRPACPWSVSLKKIEKRSNSLISYIVAQLDYHQHPKYREIYHSDVLQADINHFNMSMMATTSVFTIKNIMN